MVRSCVSVLRESSDSARSDERSRQDIQTGKAAVGSAANLTAHEHGERARRILQPAPWGGLKYLVHGAKTQIAFVRGISETLSRYP